MERLLYLLMVKLATPFTYTVVILIVADTVFGCARAIKQHQFNSCFGIDGAIRKTSMMLCIVFCAMLDLIVKIDLMPYLPNTVTEVFATRMSINHLGIAEFFAILFILYEAVSVLKNTYLCGLPTKKVYMFVRGILSKYTDELPDTDEDEITALENADKLKDAG